MVAPMIPLLGLPHTAIELVLQNMNMTELVSIALNSIRAKNHVKTLNLSVYKLWVTFLGNYVDIEVCKKTNGGGEDRLSWMFRKRNVYFYREGLKVEKWLDMLKYEIGTSMIARLTIAHEETCVSLIEKFVKEVDELGFESTDTVFHQKFLTDFPTVKAVKFCQPFANLSHETIARNYDGVSFHSDLNPWLNFKLNDLLVMNSVSIQLGVASLTDKELNKFLKLWIKGCNPRMKHLKIRYPVQVNEEQWRMILKGIPYEKADENRGLLLKNYAKFYFYLHSPATVTVVGGMDIKSRKGIRATLVLKERYFEMFVY